ncbi:MAG: CcmD family protein [Bacteroidetes bacterium]|nr:CcmD family protein [Bacteroidota bacterium]MCZ2132042.1 CcmD family protein [Bacteroidota bacterium]
METFLTKNALYVVLLITLTVWTGVALYVNRLEKKVTNLERKLTK